jgi:selenocysteine lyase/cysteine desulfurase
MREALEAMTSGSGRWIEDWDAPAEACRSDVAALSGVPEASVALLPAISVGAALVAAGLGPTDEVVVPSDEFTSILFPLLAARAGGATVREVPFAELASAVGPRTTLVAASLVQMQTGRRADLRGLLDACERVDARVLLDATQALPFLDAAEDLGRIDYVLTHAYKHLLCPRGVAFMFVRRDRLEGLLPLAANWRAADRPYERFFGGPLTLGPGARRFDVSLAWLSWVGARESLRLLREWQAQGSLDSVRQRADRLADSARQVLRGRGCGASSGAESTLVCLAVSDRAAARAALERAGVRAAIRGDAVRLSVHVWNDEADIDRAVAALAPHLAHG